jgi:zinc protease
MAAPPRVMRKTAKSPWFAPGLRLARTRRRACLGLFRTVRVGFDRQRDAFTMWTAPKATDAAACLALELDLLHAWLETGVTAAELTFVQQYLIRSHAFEIDTARKRVHQRLESELFSLPEGYHEKYLERVAAVTVESANAAVRARISETDLVIGVVGTHAEIGEAIAKAIPNLASVTVAPYDLE